MYLYIVDFSVLSTCHQILEAVHLRSVAINICFPDTRLVIGIVCNAHGSDCHSVRVEAFFTHWLCVLLGRSRDYMLFGAESNGNIRAGPLL